MESFDHTFHFWKFDHMTSYPSQPRFQDIDTYTPITKNGVMNASRYHFKVVVSLTLTLSRKSMCPRNTRSRAICHDPTSYSRRTTLTCDQDPTHPPHFQPQTPSHDTLQTPDAGTRDGAHSVSRAVRRVTPLIFISYVFFEICFALDRPPSPRGCLETTFPRHERLHIAKPGPDTPTPSLRW